MNKEKIGNGSTDPKTESMSSDTYPIFKRMILTFFTSALVLFLFMIIYDLLTDISSTVATLELILRAIAVICITISIIYILFSKNYYKCYQNWHKDKKSTYSLFKRISLLVSFIYSLTFFSIWYLCFTTAPNYLPIISFHLIPLILVVTIQFLGLQSCKNYLDKSV